MTTQPILLSFCLALLGIVHGACSRGTETPSTAPAEATTTSQPAATSQPVSAAEARALRGVLRNFLLSQSGSGNDTVPDLIAITDPVQKNAWEQYHAYNAARTELTAAINDMFHIPQHPATTRRVQDDPVSEDAPVSIDGNVAKIEAQGGLYLIRQDGKWKVDGDKLLARRPVSQASVDRAAAGVLMFNALTVAVKAGEFQSYEDAYLELQKRTATLPDAPEQRSGEKYIVRNTLENVSRALKKFKGDTGRFPTTEEGIDALFVAPSGLKTTWKGPYSSPRLLDSDNHPYPERQGQFATPKSRVLLDPWARPYVYRSPGKLNPEAFDLFSAGRDGQPDTSDDLK